MIIILGIIGVLVIFFIWAAISGAISEASKDLNKGISESWTCKHCDTWNGRYADSCGGCSKPKAGR